MKYLKKFNNTTDYNSYLYDLGISYNNLIGYIPSESKINYEINEEGYNKKIFSFKYTADKYSGFTSKRYNMIPPEELNIYAFNRIIDDPNDNTKVKFVFKKQNYIKAGIPYFIELKNESVRRLDNKYCFTVYNGEIDTSNIIVNPTLVASLYDLTTVEHGVYRRLFRDSFYIVQSATFTEEEKKPIFNYNIYIKTEYNEKMSSGIETED